MEEEKEQPEPINGVETALDEQNGENIINGDGSEPVESNEVSIKDDAPAKSDDIAAAALADFDKDSEDDDPDADARLIFFNFEASAQKPVKSGVDIDDPGDIDGKPTTEFSLSVLPEEDKAWKKPGADITDYFNYGFTEETWLRYCEKQRIVRQEFASSTIKSLSGSSSLVVLGNMSGMLRNRSYKSRDTVTTSGSSLPLKTSAVPTFSSANMSIPPPSLPFAAPSASISLTGGAGVDAFPLPSNLSMPPPGMIPGGPGLMPPGMPWPMSQEALLTSGIPLDLLAGQQKAPSSKDDDHERGRRDRRTDDYKKYSSSGRKRSRSRSSERYYSRSRRNEEGSRYRERERDYEGRNRSPESGARHHGSSSRRRSRERDRHEYPSSKSSRSGRSYHSSSRRKEEAKLDEAYSGNAKQPEVPEIANE
ncbi:hypothetical protein Ciccas_005693 [Cichlidogyrus casuarinus]|uniref:Pre-mRNA polyadenylation factor Fip1 domain-containing protein n=1 Tax=Cichlidogyrus casuarinus TaxID=1844966 RepID=A0ABD2Q8Z7_9PLAT